MKTFQRACTRRNELENQHILCSGCARQCEWKRKPEIPFEHRFHKQAKNTRIPEIRCNGSRCLLANGKAKGWTSLCEHDRQRIDIVEDWCSSVQGRIYQRFCGLHFGKAFFQRINLLTDENVDRYKWASLLFLLKGTHTRTDNLSDKGWTMVSEMRPVMRKIV